MYCKDCMHFCDLGKKQYACSKYQIYTTPTSTCDDGELEDLLSVFRLHEQIDD